VSMRRYPREVPMSQVIDDSLNVMWRINLDKQDMWVTHARIFERLEVYSV
jgi:hypothetical protein